MDFSVGIFKQTRNLCLFNPTDTLIATGIANKLVVRDAHTLQITHVFSAVDDISHIAFSRDQKYILAASYRSAVVQVWRLHVLSQTLPHQQSDDVQDESSARNKDKRQWDNACVAKVDEGVVGCARAAWSPCSRKVLTWTDFGLRLTIWNLADASALYIQHPKFADKAFIYRSDHKYVVLAERIDARDYVAIYETEYWSLVRRFSTDTTDLTDLAWSPCGTFIAVWDSYLDTNLKKTEMKYKILIYHPDGRLVKTFSAYEYGLGIKSVQWSPGGQFLAVGSYDQKIRLLNHYTFNPLMTWSLPTSVTLTKKTNTILFRESDLSFNSSTTTTSRDWPNTVSVARPRLRYEVILPPQTSTQTYPLPSIKIDLESPNARIGVSLVLFSPDACYLVAKNDITPSVLFIYSVIELRLVCVIQQTDPVRHVEWNPTKSHLLCFCTGNTHLYFWDGGRNVHSKRRATSSNDEDNIDSDGEVKVSRDIEGGLAESVEVPSPGFSVVYFRWNHDGKRVILMDKDRFCLGYDLSEY